MNQHQQDDYYRRLREQQAQDAARAQREAEFQRAMQEMARRRGEEAARQRAADAARQNRSW